MSNRRGVFYDENGRHIQAHGGSIFLYEGKYYWVGEDKSKTTGVSGIWTYGIRLYTSDDLLCWEDLGRIIMPSERIGDPTHPFQKLDRPHLLHNPFSDRWVLYVKCINKAAFLVFEAPDILGPYKLVNPSFRPFGMKVGDFDLFLDERNQACLIFSSGFHDVYGCYLNETFLSEKGEIVKIYSDKNIPFSREGICHFTYKWTHYLWTSGMTGYLSNESLLAKSDHPLGPYEDIGNPCIGEQSYCTFHSQVSCIFKGKDGLLHVLADDWLPNYPLPIEEYNRIQNGLGSIFNSHIHSSLSDKIHLAGVPFMVKANTSISEYVFGTLGLTGDHPTWEWE